MKQGSTIGNYQIRHRIGEGGMGTVFLAEHVLIGRRAAIKVLRPELSKNEDVVRRFLNEARATTAIDSPGVVQIFDFGTTPDGVVYIIMELLEGETLGQRIRREGALEPARTLRIMRQICAALANAHARGIVHRDLKPDNIHLVPDKDMPDGERTKILDFGIAKMASEMAASAYSTMAGTLLGSPAYMSPEQCRGQKVDHRSDIYSFGCIFFEVLTGRVPFHEESVADVLVAHLKNEPQAPSELNDRVSDKIDELVLCCLQKRAEARFASCDLLLVALDDCAAQEASSRPSRRLLGTAPQAATIIRIDAGGGAGGLQHQLHSWERTRALLAAELKPVLPDGLKRAEPLLLDFLLELFESAERMGDMLRLRPAAAIKDLAQREHFAIFLDETDRLPEEPLLQLKTQAFTTKVSPLVAALAQTKAPDGSVLLVVSSASQLGAGVRERSFTLRRDKGVFVVPLALPEIQRATGRREARLLLLNRIAELHAVSDPFSIEEPSIDPTRCFGLFREISALVEHISAGGRVVEISGPPGSGKSTVLAMAEYGCAQESVVRKYVHLNCSELAHRDPQRAALELRDRAWSAHFPVLQHFETTILLDPSQPPSEADADAPEPDAREPGAPPLPSPLPVDIRATLMQLLAPPREPRSAPPRRRPRPGTSPEAPQLVLILEDADWLIRMTSLDNPDTEQRGLALEFWRTLFELCKSNGHTALVTCVRGMPTQTHEPLERQLAFKRIQLGPLTLAESNLVASSLGQTVGMRFSRWALRRLHRESGGNVYALRLLCSALVRMIFIERGKSPLAISTIDTGEIDDAAKRVAEAGNSFRVHVEGWLDGTERLVLQHVARERPRSVRQVRKALHEVTTAEKLERAHSNLELMGFIGHRRGRQRVTIPLLERWVTVHLDPPRPRKVAIENRRITTLTLGFVTTALIFGLYWTWSGSSRSLAEQGDVATCKYELDYPNRIGEDETVEITAHRTCAVPPAIKPTLKGYLSSFHSIVELSSDCTEKEGSCATRYQLKAARQARPHYKVRLHVADAAVVEASMKRDSFVRWRKLGESGLQVVAFLPLILALVLTYFRDVKRSLLGLLGRGEPPAPAANA